MNASDLALEYRIDLAALELATVATPEQRREIWGRLRELVEQRSADRVREMERERGLA